MLMKTPRSLAGHDVTVNDGLLLGPAPLQRGLQFRPRLLLSLSPGQLQHIFSCLPIKTVALLLPPVDS